METTWRQGWSRCLEKREQRWQQLKELMKLQTFSQLCFAGVQLMRPRRCIFAVLPRSSSVSVHQVAHAASHSCGLSSPTTPAFQGRTLGAPRAAEPCVSQLPASQAGEWSLVAREKTAASETSPAAAGLSLCSTCTTLVSSWLSHTWASCSTPHWQQPRFSVQGILTALMLSLFAVALGCVWFAWVQLQSQVSSELALKADVVESSLRCPTFQDSSAWKARTGDTICPKLEGRTSCRCSWKNQLQEQLLIGLLLLAIIYTCPWQGSVCLLFLLFT